MLEPVSVGLKFAFLIVLYLFLLWVSRSALRTCAAAWGRCALRRPRPPPADATGLHSATSRRAVRPTDSSRDLWSSALRGTPQGWSTRSARAR